MSRHLALLPLLIAALFCLSRPASAAFTYSIDDGVREASIGLAGGGDFIALNSFPLSAGNETINSISIAFGTGTALNGLPYLAVLWSDPNGDGNPNDAMVLATAPGVVSSAGTDTFITTSVVPTLVTTSNFFVGFELQNQPTSTFPAAIDRTAPTFLNRSFVAGGPAGTGNIFNLSANSMPVGPIENSSTAAGNWLIRADAVGQAVPDATSTFALSLTAFSALAAFALKARSRPVAI